MAELEVVLIPFRSGLSSDGLTGTASHQQRRLNPLQIGSQFGPFHVGKRNLYDRLNPLQIGSQFGPGYLSTPEESGMS